MRLPSLQLLVLLLLAHVMRLCLGAATIVMTAGGAGFGIGI